ncbi:MAG: putative CRISPR-associated protein [Bacteroidota bacterium]
MRAVIVTVGTSLITNFQKYHPELPVSSQNLKQYLQTYFNKASAEVNSLDHLKIYQSDFLHFVCSDNEEGELCASMLAGFYAETQRLLADVVKIPGLAKNYQDFQNRGLKNFINTLADIIEKHQNDAVIVATGGFKAEIAYATLIGLLYRLPVHYLHEDFTGLVTMPFLPVTFDFGPFETYDMVFQDICNAPTRKDAVRLIAALPPELQSLFHKNDQNKYDFSPLGQAVKRAYYSSVLNNRSKKFRLEIAKEHSHLWGDGDIEISAVPDQDIRKILQRIIHFAPLIKRFYLDFMEKGHVYEPYLELKKKESGVLTYKIHCSQGSQYLKIYTQPDQETRLLELVGERIYP